jgi:hypothetical protein
VLRLSTFFADVLGTVLAGFSTASSAAVTGSDSVLVALGKLQAQVTAGGGSSGVRGTAVLNFGATPGTNRVTTVVTGQSGILSTSVPTAFLTYASTATHNAEEHAIVPMKLVCGSIIAGTGFTIYATTDWRLDGTFAVSWAWV